MLNPENATYWANKAACQLGRFSASPFLSSMLIIKCIIELSAKCKQLSRKNKLPSAHILKILKPDEFLVSSFFDLYFPNFC
jgi:hypothetical protein